MCFIPNLLLMSMCNCGLLSLMFPFVLHFLRHFFFIVSLIRFCIWGCFCRICYQWVVWSWRIIYFKVYLIVIGEIVLMILLIVWEDFIETRSLSRDLYHLDTFKNWKRKICDYRINGIFLHFGHKNLNNKLRKILLYLEIHTCPNTSHLQH